MQSIGRGMIFGIDAWSNQVALENFDADTPDHDAHRAYWSKMNMAAILGGAMKAIDENWLTDFAVLMRGRSELCADRFADASIDILHIDGDHMEISSCRDVALWLPKVKTEQEHVTGSDDPGRLDGAKGAAITGEVCRARA